MTTDEIKIMLDSLATLQAKLEVIELDKQAALAEAVPPEVKARLDEIETSFGQEAQETREHIAHLTDIIKAQVIVHGATVKGTYMQAVYAKGRVTWDGKKLDGMMSIIPALADARKEGEPSVSFRAVK